jgi:hypothetical protein
MIRSILAALLLLAIPSILCATLPGEALQDVLKERGMPLNKMDFRNVKVLLYADVEIRLENDIVVTVTPRPNATPGKAAPTPPPPKRR